jgi:hypothetical protein
MKLRPFTFLALCIFMALNTYAQTDGPTFLTRTIMYFGFRGGVYLTEVPIPIQEIRYQHYNDSRLTTSYYKYIIDYTKGFGYYPFDATLSTVAVGSKLAEPYLTPGLVYSIYTDPFTGETLIVLRPRVKFQKSDGTLFNPNLGTNLPVPVDVSVTMVPAPPLPAPPTRLVDQSATKVIAATDSDSDSNIIQWKDYVFVPDGGKMPNFGQIMKHQWFVAGPLSVLVKHEPEIKAKGSLPELQGDWSSGLSFGLVTGTMHTIGVKSSDHGNLFRTSMSYSLPLFMFGVNTTPVNIAKDSTGGNGAPNKYVSDGTKVAFNFGIGAGFQISSFAITGIVGQDFLLDSDAKVWPYQHKWWYGFTVGISLNKLLGISSSPSGASGPGGAGSGSPSSGGSPPAH